jgi:hypothetical protein
MLRVPLIAVSVAFLLMAESRHVAASEGNSVAGVYACEGLGPNEQPYRALLQIVQHGDRVRARWTFRDGPPVEGLGLLRHGVLAITYFNPRTIGLVIYRVDDDRIVVGEWVTPGARGVYRESLTKLLPNHVPAHPQPEPEAPQPSLHPLVRV